jgi:hypothetical protein
VDKPAAQGITRPRRHLTTASSSASRHHYWLNRPRNERDHRCRCPVVSTTAIWPLFCSVSGINVGCVCVLSC